MIVYVLAVRAKKRVENKKEKRPLASRSLLRNLETDQVTMTSLSLVVAVAMSMAICVAVGRVEGQQPGDTIEGRS